MKTLLLAIGMLALVGCKNMTPIGPFAKEVPITQQGQPIPKSDTSPPAIRPTPPTMLITPGEVNADNAHTAASKLTSELSNDSKTTPNAPVTAEISRVRTKGGTQ